MKFGTVAVMLGILLLWVAAEAQQTVVPAEEARLLEARNAQDRDALGSLAASLAATAAKKASDAGAQYNAALSFHYLAEVNLELQDKGKAREAAEQGIPLAKAALGLDPGRSEYHRLLGALCGQVIPANVLAGLRYGQCALESVNKAIELDPKSSANWLSRGVGNYYLPEAFGGGIELAIKDFQKAIALDPQNADAYLWLGIALRRAKRFDESKKALQRSLDLNPKRKWASFQMAKTLLRQ